jgi:competence protein ComFC
VTPVKLTGLVTRLMDFCYPGACACCGAGTEGAAALCDGCDVELRKLETAPACRSCGKPLAEPGAPCGWCLGDGVPHYEWVLRLGVFGDPLKHLVHQLKYHRRWPLAEVLADRLLEQEPVKGLMNETDVLVPVPLHRLRQIGRGYNQAEIVARRLASRCRKKLARPVVRLRNTESQTNMPSAAKREENMRDAFALLDGRAVRGKRVVVVDDVMTTGATLRAVAQALRPALPASLCAVVLAVADPKGRDFKAK